MSDLQQQLDQIKQRIEGNMPPGYLKIMHAATRELQESGIESRVAKAGTIAPPIHLENQNGEIRDATEMLKTGPLVLTFYRGFWCAYCNADLAYLNRYVNDIDEAGATVLAVSPEKQEYSRKIIGTQRLHFDVLWDQGNAVAERYGVKFAMPTDLIELYRDKLNVNLKLYHGDGDWTLPIAARFLIDTDGVIRYSESSADYRMRPDPDDLMDVLKAVA